MKKRNILIGYLLLSFIWLFLTDYLLEKFDGNMMLWQYVKGAVYIGLTGCFIYSLLTKHEESEQAKQGEQRLSTLINAMVDFVNFKDGEGRWIEANEFGLKLFQLEHVNYRGKKDSELADYTEFYSDALRYCETSDEEAWQAGGITYCEETVPIPNGENKIFDTIKVPLFEEDGSRKGLVVIGRDITERRITEQKLAESQQRYKSLFEYNPDLVYMVDLKGRITNLNPQFEVITGYESAQYVGEPILQFVADEDRQAVRELFYQVIESGTGSSNNEMTVIRKDGRQVILSCTLVPMVIDNQIVGAIGYSKDITKLKETEERLRRTEKLSVAGELAASVAHEIRNPLTALRGFVQLLHKDDDQHDHYYNIMIAELDRINQIAGEMLILAKPQQLKFQMGDLERIMQDVVALARSQANYKGVEIAMSVKGSVPLINCECNQLKQVFLNLMKNSIEADSTLVDVSLEAAGDQHVKIKVQDNGCGIPEERIKRLGEPFFSYKEKGTGLGLTVSYRILDAHKGKMKFDSKLGEGTTVEILLPVAEPALETV
nr:PAS domain S-box protein [Ectobacillus ponti]